jgi:PKD repeat protein
LTLAGGGGGGTYSTTASNRGQGGYNGSTVVGGLGAYRTTAGTNPTASTGSGGGGAGSAAGTGTSGSGGVVIIRFVTPPSPPVASFTKTATVLRIPKILTVTDTSTNTPTSWEWSWGDGTANSTTQNPTHQYTKRGIYTINMEASNANGKGVATAQTVRVVGYENVWY